jgi:hypothetical protein
MEGNQMSEPVKIVIGMSGGCLTGVASAGVPVDYIVVDHDLDGIADHEIVEIEVESGQMEDAYLSPGSASINGPYVLGVFEAHANAPAAPEPRTAAELIERYGSWGEHPDHTERRWRDDEGTRRGYWDWVANEIELADGVPR